MQYDNILAFKRSIQDKLAVLQDEFRSTHDSIIEQERQGKNPSYQKRTAARLKSRIKSESNRLRTAEDNLDREAGRMSLKNGPGIHRVEGGRILVSGADGSGYITEGI